MRVPENKKAFSLIQHTVAAWRCIKISEVARVSEMFDINVLYWQRDKYGCEKEIV